MVFLVVKGTQYPDEFLVERHLSDAVGASAAAASATDATSGAFASPSIVPGIAHILNKRHQVRLMLMSAQDLADLSLHNSQRGSANENPDESCNSLHQHYTATIEQLHQRLKDTKTPVADDEFDQAEEQLRAMTSQLFPAFCTHPDGAQAALQQLYTQHEDPDLNEVTRLIVYHCRVVMDPQWKANERVAEDTAALWFCGKPMEQTLAKYAGRNEKSKIIVKVAPRAGPAPSGEPRMRYEDQRALFHAMRQRRESFAHLEDSELRDRVLQQTRGAMHIKPASGGAALGGGAAGASSASSTLQLRTEGLRPIYAHKEERELPMA